MTISELIKDWTPNQSKILRDWVRAQGVPRTSYYQLIAQPLGQMRIEVGAIFARFIGCSVDYLPRLVKLECFTHTPPFADDHLTIRYTVNYEADGINSEISLYGSQIDYAGYLVLRIQSALTLAAQ